MSLAPRARPLRIKSVNSKISHDMTLLPGDLIACGTSVGVGVMKEPVNTVTVAIDEIGELTNELGSSGDAFSALATPPAPVGWQYLRSYFRLPEPHIAARHNRLPAISWKPSRNDWQSHFSGDAFSALATPPAPVRWHRAMLTPLASHPWSLRVLFRVAARQNRRHDRRVPAKARL